MCQWTGFDVPDQIGLRDEIFPLCRIAVRGQGDGTVLGTGGAICIDVDISLVIIAIQHRPAKAEVGCQLAIKPKLRNLRLKSGAVNAGRAKKLVTIARNGAVWLACSGCDGRDASVCCAVVIHIFIREPKLPSIVEVKSDIGIPCIAFSANIIAVAVEIFVDRIDPHCCGPT